MLQVAVSLGGGRGWEELMAKHLAKNLQLTLSLGAGEMVSGEVRRLG